MEPSSPLSFRAATAEDHSAFVRFFGELGVDDPIPPAEQWVREQLPETYFLENASGQLVAYAFLRFFVDEVHVVHVVVEPALRSRGLGSALMESVAALIRARGLTKWRLNVKVENIPAIRLYERMGMTVGYRTHVLGVPWALRQALANPPASVEVGLATQAEHEGLETHYGLPRGSLQTWGALPQNFVFRCIQRSQAGETPRYVGLARFNASFRGAMPFRAETPACARALVEAMHAHPSRQGDEVQLVVEDGPEVAQQLLSAGARLKYEIFLMRGEVPKVRVAG